MPNNAHREIAEGVVVDDIIFVVHHSGTFLDSRRFAEHPKGCLKEREAEVTASVLPTKLSPITTSKQQKIRARNGLTSNPLSSQSSAPFYVSTTAF